MYLVFVCYLPGLICWGTVGDVAGDTPDQRLKAHKCISMEANSGQ